MSDIGEEVDLTYPSGLYEYLVRKVNSSAGTRFITISFPNVHINFQETHRKGKWTTIDWLYEELSNRLIHIKDKYGLSKDEKYNQEVKLDYSIEKVKRVITISGYHNIPIKSFGNMLSITLWTWLTFNRNLSPKEDPEAKNILAKYDNAFKLFKDYWNRAPRKKVVANTSLKCHICGKEAKYINQWKYEREGIVTFVNTPVCEKHKFKVM